MVLFTHFLIVKALRCYIATISFYMNHEVKMQNPRKTAD